MDLLGVADFALGDLDLERRVLNVLALALDRDTVLAHLPGGERDAEIAIGQLLEEARLLEAARRLNRRVQ